MNAALRVLHGGLLTSVQDDGRGDARRYGVPPGGAMDSFALHVANRLVGNPPGAAALELLAGGAAFELLRSCLIAFAGADLGATLDGVPLPPWLAIWAARGSRLALAGQQGDWGARAYLALAGGVDVPLLLGARSTYLPGGFGGFAGRALRAGDIIASGPVVGQPLLRCGLHWPQHARPAYSAQPALRFIPGPHEEFFAADALALLSQAELRVGPDSNRMGYRLDGVQLAFSQPCNLPSLGVVPGTIQVPPDGRPILLMADAQTVGGYPIIGVVIAPDLPLAAQLLPGDRVRLAPTSQAEALAAHRLLAQWAASALAAEEPCLQLALSGALV